MERKWIIAIVIIAIVVVGFSGWYFLYGVQKPKPIVKADVTIDQNDYTTPINWTLTAIPSTTNVTSHTITNKGTNATSMTFNVTISHLKGNQWIEVWNGTGWFNGTRWVSSRYAAVNASIVVAENQSAPISNPFGAATTSSGLSNYYYSLTYDDQKIYLNLDYLNLGGNPTVDGKTVFAYVAFDVNGTGVLGASDKAFNFTSNPGLENDLEVYTPSGPNSWNATPASPYAWNGSVSPGNVPINVSCSSNRANIKFTIPFSYIGAQMGGKLGFAIQAFGHEWNPTATNATTPSKYTRISISPLPAAPNTFPSNIQPNTTQRFYTEVVFATAATGNYSGEYRVVFEFQATVKNNS